ncbi:helix-turn-helix domain-containing protein [uncultured Ruegeria sp.]|uniref:winged helix-turn-helix transcriptional regulator n=1 Tax=uncultured Ruegeria sp. TaxID=259304 RepID=UPI00262E8466|nr:helix-turn-helix domain-containing protein [uncultured Ruegeria sp.]
MSHSYGQWCPIAKSTEILGEKWTMLIVRELLMGSTRFSELQRGLGAISPTLLTRRLVTLEEYDLVYKRRIQGGRGHEYLPTASCRQLQPILLALGSWGMEWSKAFMSDADYDVELLMLYLQRSIVPENLPGSRTVVFFQFTDFDEQPKWWITVEGGNVDVCTTDPGLDVDVFITTKVRAMVDAWLGHTTYKAAKASGEMEIIGPAALTRNMTSWLSHCIFASLPNAEEILAAR